MIGQARSSQRYQSKKDTSEEKRLVQRVHELVREFPRFGYRRIGQMLKREGWSLNFKRMYRIWKQITFGPGTSFTTAPSRDRR